MHAVPVVENDQSPELKDLELPGDATDVSSFAVETLFNYVAHLGAVRARSGRRLDYQDLSFARMYINQNTQRLKRWSVPLL